MECRKPQKRKNLRLLILTTNLSKPGHDVAGLFFCLASAEGAGLLFCPAAMHPYTSVYSEFCAVHAKLYRTCRKTAHRALQRLFLRFAPFNRPQYQTGTSGYNATCATPNAVQVSATAYYNNVYKGARVRPCYGSMPDGAAYRRPCQPGGVSSYRLRIAGKCCTRRTR